jgi:hypothetical protein
VESNSEADCEENVEEKTITMILAMTGLHQANAIDNHNICPPPPEDGYDADDEMEEMAELPEIGSVPISFCELPQTELTSDRSHQ